MNYFSRAPLIRLIIPLSIGIIISIHAQKPVNNLGYFIIGLFIISAIYSFSSFSGIYKFRWIFGLLTFLSLFVTGYYLVIIKTEAFSKNHFSKLNYLEGPVLGRILEPIAEKEKSFKTTMEVLAVRNKGNWIGSEGSAMVYLKKDSNSKALELNDLIIADPLFKEVTSPSNPAEFNYKKYLSYHFIYDQIFLKAENWMPVKKNKEKSFVKAAYDARNNLINVFKKYNIKNNELAVASALMIGYKDKLDSEIKRAYSGTGAMHVLAVSGLHVGIIYYVINFLLLFFDKIPYGNIIKALLLVFALLAYALLTGLSPSVLRATTMFIFIIIGKVFNRNANIYNTLAASALVLLLINPYLIMDVGFQLSYLAVIGIVYLQPKIYSWFQVDNWIIDKTWALTSVTLSAQLATFPLGLYYFHQFPNYFLIANLIVIPVAALIIYFGIGLLIFSGLEYIGQVLAYILSLMIEFLNTSVLLIEKLPYSVMGGININPLQTCLLYVLIIFFVTFFVLKKVKYLIIGLMILSIFLLAGLLEKLQQNNQKKLIIYNISGHSAINFIHGRKNSFITDLSPVKDRNKIEFHINNYWIKLGVAWKNILHTDQLRESINTYRDLTGLLIKDNFFKFHNCCIGWINNKTTIETPKQFKIKLDYVIISNAPELTIEDILKNYRVKKIIIDSSNPVYRAKQFEEQCYKLGIDCWAVYKRGAFIADM